MSWGEWIDITFLKSLVRHCSATTMTILSFRIVFYLAEKVIDDQRLKTAVGMIDGFVLIGLIMWLVCVLAVQLWKRRPWHGDSTPCIVLA